MAKLTPAEARLLDKEGFIEKFEQILSTGVTRFEAYYQTEGLHAGIRGDFKYADFKSFDKVVRREAKKSPVA